MSVTGIPTSRVSDLFIRDRLLQQTQYDQSQLYNVQMQLSTGHRIQLPSEDPVASMQIVGLQRLLTQKTQVQTNLQTNQSFMGSTDASLSQISGMLIDVRGTALGVIGTTASDTQRQAAAQQVQQAIQQLMDAGNQQFRGRYLFAGSTTAVRPFDVVSGGFIEYQGNDNRLSSYSDTDLLFSTNLTGDEVFGAVSAQSKGADLHPNLTAETRLSDLRGGKGINLGSIQLSDGTHTATVNLSGADTIGDVAAMIRAQGSEILDTEYVSADVTPQGLQVELHNSDGSPAPALTIREVGDGTSAYELGILAPTSTSSQIVGTALNPILRTTTAVSDTLGAAATAFLHTTGSDNDLIIQADRHGSDRNNVLVDVVNDPTIVPGNETVTLVGSTLTVRIAEGQTTAQQVVDAFTRSYDATTMPFRAALDPMDRGDEGLGHVAVTDPTHPLHTAFGWGEDLDTTHGMQIVNGDQSITVDLSTAQTVEDILNLVNGQGAGLQAEINSAATGINIRSRYSGANFAIGENGGTTATQLGLRTFTDATALDDLNFGAGVSDYQGSGTCASAQSNWVSSNNDLIISARQTGSGWNGYKVVFEDLLPDGNEGVTYDKANKTVHVEISPGKTTANEVIDMFQKNSDANTDFQIALNNDDGSPNNGTGLVWPGATLTLAGGDSGDVDFTITRKDRQVMEIDIHGCTTVQDVIDKINNNVNNHPELPVAQRPLQAQLAVDGNGIELLDRTQGSGTLTVTRAQLSTAAIGLGLIPSGKDSNSQVTPGTIATAHLASAAPKSALVFETKTPGIQGNGVQVVFQDNSALMPPTESFTYDQVHNQLIFGILPGTTTAATIQTLLRGDATASQIFDVQFDQSDHPPNDGSGLVDIPTDPVVLRGGQPEVLTGTDVNPQETEGTFTALLRLQHALQTNDNAEAQRAMSLLDGSTTNMNFSRAELGAREQGLGVLNTRLDSENTNLQDALSQEYDADFVQVVSELTGRQTSLQASLQAMAQITKLTLLNYL